MGHFTDDRLAMQHFEKNVLPNLNVEDELTKRQIDATMHKYKTKGLSEGEAKLFLRNFCTIETHYIFPDVSQAKESDN
ncbi:hypothetical protein BKI52_02715 [marine bacterium AO1-C]|nr:hypothetical protein BKI52_02715 [marine bacterium AO1-C]